MENNTKPEWHGEDRRRQVYTQAIPSRIPSWLIVVGTLLVNIVIIWTPLVVLMTNRVAELDAVKVIANRYIDDKIAQRVATLESDVKAALVISNKYIDDKVPMRLVELEMQVRQMVAQLADHPHRVSLLENEFKRFSGDTVGLGPRTVALELVVKQLNDETKGLPNRVLTAEQAIERLMEIQKVNVKKVEDLEHSEWVHHSSQPANIHNSYNGGGP